MELQDVANGCYSWSRLYSEYTGFGTPNARTLKKFREDCEGSIDTSHFTGNGKPRKHKIVEIECPACGEYFETRSGGCNATKTCSKSCSNKYFRKGLRGGKFGADSYRVICFLFHEKECIVCGEDKVVEVHHLDEDRENNDPHNLVPLCPTHHRYWHSRYKYLIEDEVLRYVESLTLGKEALERLEEIIS